MSSSEHHGAHGHGQPGGADPVNTDVAYEKVDVSPGAIYVYLIGLAVAVILTYAVCVFILRATTNVAVNSDTPPPPVREEMGATFQDLPPEPRLQGVPGHSNDPQADLREKLKQDLDANLRFQWIDQNAGIAQIPVKDAMRIIAEKGLPGSPKAEQKQP
jgi:hypothetical protein